MRTNEEIHELTYKTLTKIAICQNQADRYAEAVINSDHVLALSLSEIYDRDEASPNPVKLDVALGYYMGMLKVLNWVQEDKLR